MLTSPQVLMPGDLLLYPTLYVTAKYRLFMLVAHCSRLRMDNVSSRNVSY